MVCILKKWYDIREYIIVFIIGVIGYFVILMVMSEKYYFSFKMLLMCIFKNIKIKSVKFLFGFEFIDEDD